MPVYQLVYISAETRPMSDDDLEQILAAARHSNAQLGITGMLLYDEGSFIQALEGDEAIVEGVLERIGRDRRHGALRVLLRGMTPQRDFRGWTMGFHNTRVDDAGPASPARGLSRAFEDDPSVVRKALLSFREGHWRQAG